MSGRCQALLCRIFVVPPALAPNLRFVFDMLCSAFRFVGSVLYNFPWQFDMSCDTVLATRLSLSAPFVRIAPWFSRHHLATVARRAHKRALCNAQQAFSRLKGCFGCPESWERLEPPSSWSQPPSLHRAKRRSGFEHIRTQNPELGGLGGQLCGRKRERNVIFAALHKLHNWAKAERS